MTRSIATLGLAVLALGLALAPSAAAFAHGSSGSSGKHSGGDSSSTATPAPTPDEEAAKYIQTVTTSRAGQNDGDAVTSVGKLLSYWNNPSVTSATKQPIPGLVAWYAKRKSATVALAGINALASIGKGPGAKNLASVLEGLLAQKDASPDLVAAAFAGMRTAADPDPSVLAPVIAAISNKDKTIGAKAIDVFGAFETAPAPARKHLFEVLMASFDAMAAAAAKGDDKDATDRWTALASPAAGALGTLAHQQFTDLAAAHKWAVEHGGDTGAWK
jgi:hypothetical protein